MKLRGLHNTAKVFTNNIDGETILQLKTLLDQEFISGEQIRIMPDCHAGKGCVIGTTMTLNNRKVVPNLTGVDIGCGMLSLKIDTMLLDLDLELLDEVIHNKVPSGFNIHEKAVTTFDLSKIIAPIDKDRAIRSIGSLGGGNHFIEVDKDRYGDYWLVIHTGSRHLGVEICDYYQDKGYAILSDTKEEIDACIKRLKLEGRQQDIEKEIQVIKENHKCDIPHDLAYVEGTVFDDYIHDMEIAQRYAKLNRQTIADIIIQNMNWSVTDSFDTIHNYIDTENMILRKGSISAQRGERVLIPMNMRDGSLICIGKGNPDWNYSAPHGAGRILSRNQAKAQISLEDFEETMQGIYTTSVKASTIDESPFAYKPMREIIENVKDTVDIMDIIKPVYNYKAS